MSKRLVVISLDALMVQDLEYLKTQPNFKNILEKSSIVKEFKTIYPSLTYPIHTTVITGKYPKDHGIYHNMKFGVEREIPDHNILGSDWYWYDEAIKVDTLVDVARRKGLTTSTVLWPVMGGKRADYVIPEIWPTSKEKSMREVVLEASRVETVEKIYDKFAPSMNWIVKPDLDGIGILSSIEIIKTIKPELIMIHMVSLDHYRHESGIASIFVDRALERYDSMVGDVIQATKDAGTFDETNFFLFGDHGQININQICNLNVLLEENGLIQTGEDHKVKAYTAYSFTAGLSTHIHTNGEDKRVFEALIKIKEAYPEFIERIFTKEEVRDEYGLDGEFSFVVEGKNGTVFKNELGVAPIQEEGDVGYKSYKATHGHLPEKGGQPCIIAFGPEIKEKQIIDKGRVIDICPTLSALLDLKMEGLEGKSLEFIK